MSKERFYQSGKTKEEKSKNNTYDDIMFYLILLVVAYVLYRNFIKKPDLADNVVSQGVSGVTDLAKALSL